MKDSAYKSTQKNSNALRPIDGISVQFILTHLDWAKNNEIKTYFCHAQKQKANKVWNKYHI